MAYRVTSDAAENGRLRPRSPAQRSSRAPRGDRTLSRNAAIAGVTLSCICLVSAGVALTGRDHSIGSVPNYVASHKAFKTALVEAADQAQIERPTRFAARPAPDTRVKMASIEPAREPLAHVPLPHARPKERLARIPLPRERVVEKAPELSAPVTVAAHDAPASEPQQTMAAVTAPPPSPQVEKEFAPANHAPIVTAALDPPDAEATSAVGPSPQPSPRKRGEGEESAARPFTLMSYAPTRETLFEADLTGSIGNPARAGATSSAKAEDPSAPAETTRTVATPAKLAALGPSPRPSPRKRGDGEAKADAGLKPAKPTRPLSIRDRLWGSPVRLASLTPMDTAREADRGIPRPPYDRQTAVYVITDKKVYLPDGTVLEAHSGFGDKMDDPRFVHVRMRGATPPHVYDLTMREALFHGVEALRMTPIGGESAIFGRDGILAHTYMLGRSGQSNGCVSFRDYDTFLDAYKAGKINRLAVIARLD
jgi:hypothetical protein